MKKINMEFVFPLTAIVILVLGLSTQLFNISPAGKLLNPFVGAIQNEKSEIDEYAGKLFSCGGLSDSVSVFFDSRRVPHIRAGNQNDLYFAQGYVSASLRLWQMDFISYVAAGRLSEIFSDNGYLEHDREQRRLGLLGAARKSLAMIEKDSMTNSILTAYTNGVNAYISKLNYRNMPFEYKLLDYAPEQWTKLKSVLIMKYMASILSGFEQDKSMTDLMLSLGEESFNKYYPDFHSYSSPFVYDSVLKANNSTAYLAKPGYLNYSFVTSNTIIPPSTFNPHLGSNSWAVAGKKTQSGHPILCSDPHLGLSFPAVWMEMQLTAPGMNVYGVSIPGTPAVIIGFNENVAWGLTNGCIDVKDWYKLKVDAGYKKYEFDGKWLDLECNVEEIKRKGQRSFYDTIYSTKHGPIMNNKGSGMNSYQENYALRWELNTASNDMLTFIELSKAKDYNDYRAAIKNYKCPVQNFIFACKDNTISINHQGNIGLKWAGQGKFMLDGTKSSHLCKEYIPDDSLPHALNPKSGFVFSGNQHPTYSDYRYYYNGYFTESRANEITKLLEKENAFSIKKMEAVQLNNTDFFATEALPLLIRMMRQSKITDAQLAFVEALGSWKGTYNSGDKDALFFDLWMNNIRDYTWDEMLGMQNPPPPPSDYVLLGLIKNKPGDVIFDNRSTDRIETAADIVREAFINASDTYEKIKAERSVDWSENHKVDIMHLTNIEAFSKMGMPSAGSPSVINATDRTWGPSWRMIVELGDRPTAVGIFAGGQSGNVGSPYYDSFVNDWNKGNYYPLQFYISGDEAKKGSVSSWILK
ncbi:MAG: penicillin amidase [Bacteroidetes bacterium]|nr:penicillin amidase [Bacteroidota bacterium]